MKIPIGQFAHRRPPQIAFSLLFAHLSRWWFFSPGPSSFAECFVLFRGDPATSCGASTRRFRCSDTYDFLRP